MDWLSIGSSVLGAVGNLWSANNANDMQRQNLENQMAFNREVMQNRHQWEVEDLRQAGLNPLMSVTSPTGTLSAPSAPAAQKAELGNSALALGQLQIADKQAEAQLLSAKANAKNADTAFEAMQNENRNISSQIRAREVQNETSWLQVNAAVENAKSQSELWKAQTVKQYLENNFLPSMYTAQLDEIETRIANSIAETAAKILLMDRQGQAALTNAAAQTMMAHTLEANGVSLRELNFNQIKDIQNKMGIESAKWNLEKPILKLKSDIAAYDDEVFMGQGIGSSATRSAHNIGKVFGDLTGITGVLSLIK